MPEMRTAPQQALTNQHEEIQDLKELIADMRGSKCTRKAARPKTDLRALHPRGAAWFKAGDQQTRMAMATWHGIHSFRPCEMGLERTTNRDCSHLVEDENAFRHTTKSRRRILRRHSYFTLNLVLQAFAVAPEVVFAQQPAGGGGAGVRLVRRPSPCSVRCDDTSA